MESRRKKNTHKNDFLLFFKLKIMEIVSDSKLLLINFLALLGKCTVLLISKFHQLNYQKTFFSPKTINMWVCSWEFISIVWKARGRGLMGTRRPTDPTQGLALIFQSPGEAHVHKKRNLTGTGRIITWGLCGDGVGGTEFKFHLYCLP